MDDEMLMRAMVDLLRARRDGAAREAPEAAGVDALTAFLREVEAHLTSKPGQDDLVELVRWTARGRELARRSLELAAGVS